MTGSFVALGLPALAAVLVFRRVLPDEGRSWSAAALAAGWAVGLSSCTYFLWLPAAGPPGFWYLAAEVIGWTAAGAAALWWRRTTDRPVEPARSVGPWGRWLWLPFVGMAVVSARYVWAETRAAPLGVWDAITIWNFRARFLYRAGDDWPAAFDPSFHHTDYPLLLPCTIARCWGYSGAEDSETPAVVAAVFAGLTVAVLIAGLNRLRGGGQGWLAGLVLVSAQPFAFWTAKQYADVPLSFYILATGVVWAFHDRSGRAGWRLPALAGSFAGFAAWTKNEGLLFLAVVLAVRAAIALRAWDCRAGAREAVGLGLGLLPAALALGYLKLALAPPNDLVAALGPSTLTRLSDGGRYAQITVAFLDGIWEMLPYGVLVLGAYGLLVGRRPREERRPGPVGASAVVALMLAGYFLVYLTTPHDLSWHIGTSLQRLFVHVWPLAAFAFFLSLATLDDAAGMKPKAAGPAISPSPVP